MFMKLLIIQADNRQLYMSQFLEKKGFSTTVFTPNLLSGDNERKFDGAIFALPTIKNSRINCEYDVSCEKILPLVRKDGVVFSAMADDEFLSKISDAELKHYDFYKREELIILNASLTAQAVLELVLVNSNVSLSDLKILVTGYGKTGEAIADILLANKVSLTIAARKIKDRARAETKNIRAISFSEIKDYSHEFQIVINTVPDMVIGKNLLSTFSEECIFFEVASKPYGIDIGEAEKQNKKIIIASSLPGKYVSKTAGEVIAKTIINMIKEENEDGKN